MTPQEKFDELVKVFTKLVLNAFELKITDKQDIECYIMMIQNKNVVDYIANYFDADDHLFFNNSDIIDVLKNNLKPYENIIDLLKNSYNTCFKELLYCRIDTYVTINLSLISGFDRMIESSLTSNEIINKLSVMTQNYNNDIYNKILNMIDYKYKVFNKITVKNSVDN